MIYSYSRFQEILYLQQLITDHSHPNLKLAMSAFSRKNKIWSNFSPARAARWSVAVRPPMEKRRSTLVELGGGVRCRWTTCRRAFLTESEGPVSSSYFFQNLQITICHNAGILLVGSHLMIQSKKNPLNMYNLRLTGSESTMDLSSSLLEALFFGMEM